ncbi:MAG TPA: hypothetical protein VGQ62_01105 [Chloroflexota bacterium]|jgi:hypothetical protein|nr:hypothetical protein [Chloroflexota bacterium]
MTSLEQITCPFCGLASAELVSLFGSQLLLSQYRCTACRSYFEGLREDCWDVEPTVSSTSGPARTGSGGPDHDGS